MSPREVFRAVRWYVRELTGTADYDRYVERHRACPGGPAPMSRREFERAKSQQQDDRPGVRCC